MLRPGGVLLTTGPAGAAERDTFTCGHCQRIVLVEAGADPAELGGLCKVCDRLVCKYCVGKDCTPWEEKMRQFEARYEALRSYGVS